MAHIETMNQLPGIIGLFQYAPDTAKPLCDLAETLLRAPSSLSQGQRELIASYVSYLNQCAFCSKSHAAFAALYIDDIELVKQVWENPETANISPKMKALLNIAAKVQKLGTQVTPADIKRAKVTDATDREIHDTVLIAAAFCMFNRYVDGLGTFAPTDESEYTVMAERICNSGYHADRH